MIYLDLCLVLITGAQENIVEKAAQGIVHNTRRSDKVMKPFVPGGDIRIFNSGSTKHLRDVKVCLQVYQGFNCR